MDGITEIAFQIILHAGNGNASAMEVIQEAKEGNYQEADQMIDKAVEELSKAHGLQTKLIQDEASGHENQINIVLIHSQDYLMTAMTVRDLAVEIIELYRVNVR